MHKLLAFLIFLALSACSVTPKHLAEARPGTLVDIATVESEGLKVNEASRPYFECMAAQMKSSSDDASSHEKAIETAKLNCTKERESLYREFLRHDMYFTNAPQDPDEEQKKYARLLMQLTEDGFGKQLESIYHSARH